MLENPADRSSLASRSREQRHTFYTAIGWLWLEAWRMLRRITGDDAYERYLAHWRASHHAEATPLTRAAFFKAEQQRRWEGVKRCC